MLETATFGGGCFWKIEESFRELPGVIQTSAGYMGGHFENPSYLDVVARITGHAEVSQVIFDSEVVGYDALLDRFWAIHDPTSFHRQGPDRGEQYRSVIFWHTADQKLIAQESKQRLELSGKYEKPIVTEIQPASAYWLASDEHQQYLMRLRSGIVTK
jgi:peptide-methionine (S)-S-oxide reductase